MQRPSSPPDLHTNSSSDKGDLRKDGWGSRKHQGCALSRVPAFRPEKIIDSLRETDTLVRRGAGVGSLQFSFLFPSPALAGEFTESAGGLMSFDTSTFFKAAESHKPK